MNPEETHSISHKQKENSWLELGRFILYAALIVIPIRLFIAEPFIVSGSSMVPTFQTGQYLIVDELTYKLEDPSRGDVIVFRYPKDPSKYFIKRIIGLPGEKVKVVGDVVTISNKEHPDGFTLDQPYIVHTQVAIEPTSVTLKEDEYFVLGDNRPASSDSRYWGVLPKKNIIGRSFLRLFPLKNIGVLPGEHSY